MPLAFTQEDFLVKTRIRDMSIYCPFYTQISLHNLSKANAGLLDKLFQKESLCYLDVKYEHIKYNGMFSIFKTKNAIEFGCSDAP